MPDRTRGRTRKQVRVADDGESSEAPSGPRGETSTTTYESNETTQVVDHVFHSGRPQASRDEPLPSTLPGPRPNPLAETTRKQPRVSVHDRTRRLVRARPSRCSRRDASTKRPAGPRGVTSAETTTVLPRLHALRAGSSPRSCRRRSASLRRARLATPRAPPLYARCGVPDRTRGRTRKQVRVADDGESRQAPSGPRGETRTTTDESNETTQWSTTCSTREDRRHRAASLFPRPCWALGPTLSQRPRADSFASARTTGHVAYQRGSRFTSTQYRCLWPSSSNRRASRIAPVYE